jgi:hypothetical protein
VADAVLTMRSYRQWVATYGNGFRVFLRSLRLLDCDGLPPFATTGLHKGSIFVVNRDNDAPRGRAERRADREIVDRLQSGCSVAASGNIVSRERLAVGARVDVARVKGHGAA